MPANTTTDGAASGHESTRVWGTSVFEAGRDVGLGADQAFPGGQDGRCDAGATGHRQGGYRKNRDGDRNMPEPIDFRPCFINTLTVSFVLTPKATNVHRWFTANHAVNPGQPIQVSQSRSATVPQARSASV